MPGHRAVQEMFRIAKHTPDIQDSILLSLLGSKPGVRAYRETWAIFYGRAA
jgi:hypothetical protein